MSHLNASSPVLTNPLIFSSGWVNPAGSAMVKGMFNVKSVYWFQPDLSSTSSVLITKGTVGADTEYVRMKCEASGQSQTLRLGDTWWKDPYVSCIPSGTLYVYLDNK
jgi:hypothetical protein